MPKSAKFLLLFIFILALANLAVTGTFTGKGQTVADLETDIIQLRHQNLKLELELAKSGSLTNLVPKIQAANFQSPRHLSGLSQQSNSMAMR